MILCPNCHNQEPNGALFCAECGTRLVAAEMPTTTSMERSQTGMLILQARQAVAPPPAPPLSDTPVEASVSLHLIESGAILNLVGQTEFSIGRAVEGQPILPDVDLAPYEAYAHGVSRLHAAIKLNDQRLFITDLGSSNGTRLNGQKLMPNVDCPLNHGDVVALGKFKIQILIRK